MCLLLRTRLSIFCWALCQAGRRAWRLQRRLAATAPDNRMPLQAPAGETCAGSRLTAAAPIPTTRLGVKVKGVLACGRAGVMLVCGCVWRWRILACETDAHVIALVGMMLVSVIGASVCADTGWRHAGSPARRWRQRAFGDSAGDHEQYPRLLSSFATYTHERVRARREWEREGPLVSCCTGGGQCALAASTSIRFFLCVQSAPVCNVSVYSHEAGIHHLS